MKRPAIYLFALTVLLWLPVLAHAEYIDRFESTIEISPDGSFTVTETIDYVFTEDRHGMFRYIPTEHPVKPSEWYRERYIDIEVLSVTLDGDPVPYETADEQDELYLKIGDPNRTVSGFHRYVITYKVLGGISYLQYGGAEIYWNVTGNWDLGIRDVIVHLTAPPGFFMPERACYRGLLGEEGSCGSIIPDGNTIHFTASELGRGEGVTIAQAIDRTKIEVMVLERTQTLWFWIPAALLWLAVLATFVYQYKTAYKTGRSIIAQYEPYEDFKPMYAGLLFDGTLNPRDITAGIVYLAQQGYLKIKKIDRKVLFFFEVDDYEVTLVRPTDELESPFQKDVLKLLFGEGAGVGAQVTLSDLKSNVSKQKENHKILQELKKDLEKDLEHSGFFQVTVPSSYIVLVAVGLIVGVFIFVGNFLTTFSPVMVLLIIVAIVSVAILAFAYRRRTRKGYEALDHLEGFKRFLSVTDKERFAFHNAPSKSPEQFMQFLPYAIAFDVEEEWAEVFKDITIPNPDWYDGGSVGSFSAINLTTSLGAFSTAFAQSSGSSGSSGGGSVGGGGGGGGGGSW